MKCFSFSNGRISSGFDVQQDAKLGMVVFLGEDGRGRRYEKIGLLRKDPADVVEGRVLNAHPSKITVNRAQKNETSFLVLGKQSVDDSDQRILVRVKTYTGYVRHGNGCWVSIVGNAVALVHAIGAFGDAGRIGNWSDDIVIMSPGEAIAVRGSRSGRWVIHYKDADGGPVVMEKQDWDTLQSYTAEDIQKC